MVELLPLLCRPQCTRCILHAFGRRRQLFRGIGPQTFVVGHFFFRRRPNLHRERRRACRRPDLVALHVQRVLMLLSKCVQPLHSKQQISNALCPKSLGTMHLMFAAIFQRLSPWWEPSQLKLGRRRLNLSINERPGFSRVESHFGRVSNLQDGVNERCNEVSK